MTSRNDITGDLQQTKGILSKQARETYDRLFPPKKIVRGSFKWDEETGKFITRAEWNAKNYVEKGQAPMMFCNQFETFQSPVNGKEIRNKREHAYDLATTGSRTYEGREQEQKEVDRHRANEDKAFEEVINESVDETAYQIKHNYSRPGVQTGVQFELGDET